MEKILTVEDLSVELDGRKVLSGINFSISKGEVLAVIGPNGAGKSVLFRCLLGLIPNYKGKITWDKNVKIGYVPQKFAIEHTMPLTVKEFFMLKTKSTKEIHRALFSVGIDPEGHQHRPNETHHYTHHKIINQPIGVLSGGELQRIMIAWALISNPDILLFDEPTSGIDIGGEETIYHLLHNLQQQQNLTILLISHDLNIVYKYANNVICLNHKMLCFGEPHTALDPRELSSLYGEAEFFKHDKEHKH